MTQQSAPSSQRLSPITETGLYLVTDDRLPIAILLEKTEQALQAGVRVLQYRDKMATKRQFLDRGAALGSLCASYGALFLVNDHLDVALSLEAGGLHLGQDDFPANRARALLGPSRLLGLSVSAVQEAVAAPECAVDYLGVGAMYPTDTKPDAEFGGLELLRAVRRRVSLPLVAIGGINRERVSEVIAAGADAVAVVSAVYSAVDPGAAAQALLDSIARARRSA